MRPLRRATRPKPSHGWTRSTFCLVPRTTWEACWCDCIGDQRLSVAVQERESVEDRATSKRPDQVDRSRRRPTVQSHQDYQEQRSAGHCFHGTVGTVKPLMPVFREVNKKANEAARISIRYSSLPVLCIGIKNYDLSITKSPEAVRFVIIHLHRVICNGRKIKIMPFKNFYFAVCVVSLKSRKLNFYTKSRNVKLEREGEIVGYYCRSPRRCHLEVVWILYTSHTTMNELST